MDGRKIYAWICAISACLIFFSVKDLWNISHFERYRFVFQYLPQDAVLLRYKFSLAFRAAILISAIGILFRKDIFRKLIIGLSFFTIITIYWKHPIGCYRHIFRKMTESGLIQSSPLEAYNVFPWVMMACSYIVDLSIAAVIIYFFTRPSVKIHFN